MLTDTAGKGSKMDASTFPESSKAVDRGHELCERLNAVFANSANRFELLSALIPDVDVWASRIGVGMPAIDIQHDPEWDIKKRLGRFLTEQTAAIDARVKRACP